MAGREGKAGNAHAGVPLAWPRMSHGSLTLVQRLEPVSLTRADGFAN